MNMNTNTNNKENKADKELRQLLINGYSDYESDQGGGKWSTLPGVKLRKPSTGSMTNLSSGSGNSGKNNFYRHSVNIETFSDADSEFLECLVKTATEQPNEQRVRRKVRQGDKQSCKN